jgi:hypothetical protein
MYDGERQNNKSSHKILSANIKFIIISFRNRKKREPLVRFFFLFQGEYTLVYISWQYKYMYKIVQNCLYKTKHI